MLVLPHLTILYLCLVPRMSSGTQASSSSTANFKPIFEKALKEYKKKTGKDLIAHPLAVQIKDCKSPEAILAVLEGKANELYEARSGEERVVKWLNPTVNILTALSATLGQGAGLVSYGDCPRYLSGLSDIDFQIFPPTTIIFSGIGILLLVSIPAQFSARVVGISSLVL